MVKWIVLALVLLALVILALAVRSVVSRLPRLRRAVLALQQRQAQAESLRQQATVLQDRLVVLQGQARVAQQRLARIKAPRGH